MRNKSKIISIFTSICMMLVMLPSLVFAQNDISATDIVIMHTNDVHSRVQGSENDTYLGYATVKSVKDKVEEVAPVLLLDAGDALHGLPIANLSNGQNIIKIMNEVGYDAMAPGNHDFNYGANALVSIQENMEFDLLSANVTKDGKNPFKTSKIYTKGDKKIGVIGITTPETVTKADPRKVEGYSFNESSLAKILQDEINSLKSQDVDYIVALGHLGIDEESSPYKSTDVISQVEGLDIFIDGHSHSTVQNKVKDKVGKEVVIAQTGNYLNNIGQIIIHEDGMIETKLVNERSEDENIKTLIQGMNAEIQPLLDKVVGHTSVLLDGNRDPGVRTQETNLGDLVADALKNASGADVALTNGGGIRTSVDIGKITYGELNAVLPFGNIVTKIEVTGKQIFDALEFGTKDCPKAAGAFPQVSGMTYEIHTYKEYNVNGSEYGLDSRVRNIKINNENLDLNKTYTLATNDFMAAGGDGYEMFSSSKKIGEFGAMDEALVNYIESQPNGTVGQEYTSSAGRIVIYNTIEEVPKDDDSEDSSDEENEDEDTTLGGGNEDEDTSIEDDKNDSGVSEEEKEDGDTPKTGDEYIASYAILLLISMGVCGYTIRRKKSL